MFPKKCIVSPVGQIIATDQSVYLPSAREVNSFYIMNVGDNPIQVRVGRLHRAWSL
jgi:urease beta subunit